MAKNDDISKNIKESVELLKQEGFSLVQDDFGITVMMSPGGTFRLSNMGTNTSWILSKV